MLIFVAFVSKPTTPSAPWMYLGQIPTPQFLRHRLSPSRAVQRSYLCTYTQIGYIVLCGLTFTAIHYHYAEENEVDPFAIEVRQTHTRAAPTPRLSTHAGLDLHCRRPDIRCGHGHRQDERGCGSLSTRRDEKADPEHPPRFHGRCHPRHPHNTPAACAAVPTPIKSLDRRPGCVHGRFPRRQRRLGLLDHRHCHQLDVRGTSSPDPIPHRDETYIRPTQLTPVALLWDVQLSLRVKISVILILGCGVLYVSRTMRATGVLRATANTPTEAA